jgi:hypothetical protein
VGFWSLPLKTYLALGSTEPVIARISAELGNMYLSAFREKCLDYQSIIMKNIDDHLLYGYVDRAGPVCQELIATLSDGKSHDITLRIVAASDDKEYQLITEILSHTWILPAA